MRIKSVFIVCLITFGYVSAQYQDSYENNVNPYPRSQYDSGESYAPPARAAVQSYPPARSSSPSSYSRPKAPIQPKAVAKLTPEEEEEAAAKEEEKKPSELELMLANSKFTCGNLKDGYYADNSLNCQVFHYCVGGAKHSWMCPANTVFHQVHLNCVPSNQDICSQSEKYHIVNEYLHKPIEQSLGPNKTVRYHQRYYPEEFLGDPLAPNGGNSIQQYPPSPNRPAYNPASSYEDETPISYRQPVRSNKPQYSSYPQGYPQPKPVATKPKSSYSSGNYPVSLISSPQPSRKPVASYNDNYDDNSSSNYKPTIYTQPSAAAVRSQPPSYNRGNYQPNYSAAASSQAYKPSAVKPQPVRQPVYSSYQSAPASSRPSAGYESNAKPYNDYSGVTYENEENEYEK